MPTIYEYGKTVVEIFKHSDSELQEVINEREREYQSRAEGLHYKGLAASIDFTRYMPLEQSLLELQVLIKQGYTLIKATARNLYFNCQLRKPDEIIASELLKVTELAMTEYTEARYVRNVAETQRQLEFSINQRARKVAAAAAAETAKAALEHQASEEERALQDLLSAYSPKAKAKTSVKVQQEVAA